MFKSIYQYRHFIFSSIKNDLIMRFKRSKLGAMWVVLNPLSQVLIFALVLSNIMCARIQGMDSPFSFAIYLMAGTLAWNLFSEIINKSVNLFLDNASLMKKINFPKVTMPIIMIGSCVLNNILLFLSILVIFLILGHGFTPSILMLIPVMCGVVVFAFGIGLILGILNVFIRDIAQVVPIFLQIMFWFTPIVYPANIIPEKYIAYLHLNPMYPIVEAYHDILLYGKAPDIFSHMHIYVSGILISLFGFYMFRKASPEMVDVL
jgi:lipopolysaccharide transport system permease protein